MPSIDPEQSDQLEAPSKPIYMPKKPVSTSKKSPTRRRPATKSKSVRSRTTPRSTRTTRRAPARASLRARIAKRFARRRSPARSSKRSSPWSTISLDRKLDLAGIFLLFIGLLTLLFLFSSNNSTSTGLWLSFLGRAFGWGAYLFPIGLFAVGMWLVLRHFESIPQVSLERVIGVIFLFIVLLVALHFAQDPPDREASLALAERSQGGGYTGAVLLELMVANLGIAGTIVAMLAWGLIALAFTLDRPVVDLFSWLPPLILRVQDWFLDRFEARRTRLGNGAIWRFPMKSGEASQGSTETDPGTHSAPGTGQGMAAGELFSSPQDRQERIWNLPPVAEILDPGDNPSYDDEYDRHRAHLIEETLASFGAPGNVVEINRGPTITQFGVEPDFIETRSGRTRVRVGKIASLVDDLALALSARTIRVQAPVPGKGYVGIEVPNDEISMVTLRDVIESEAFKRLKPPLRFALGQDVAGNAVAADLTAMPHLLIAGATGSGKSVCVNSIICCLLLHNTPDDLRMIMVDPKRVELTGYNGIPHLLAPVVVNLERVVGSLQWVLREMDMRYKKLAEAGTRNIAEYNAKLESSGQKKLPRLVVVIDELADLMMIAPDETERTITRLAQLARATGIHLVIATQRPSVDVVTGLIKANFPARIAFAVASGVDSRVILDQPGAERLLGRGDMLFQAPDAAAPIRLQGTFVADHEIQLLVYNWLSQAGVATPEAMASEGAVDVLPSGVPLKQLPMFEREEERDPLYDEAVDLCRRQGRASISMLQRRMRIGYTRAARLIEKMQEQGIISSDSGPQGFEVLDYGPLAPPLE
jgi:DNA segregation ATPase FtsK/SpoIIIE, S-DNA-T family